MAILGFSRSTKMGVSAIVGLGNKADIDEDDLLTFFEHDDNTNCSRCTWRTSRTGARSSRRPSAVSKKKPIVVLKAGATTGRPKAAARTRRALAGNDKVYDDILRAGRRGPRAAG